MVREQHGLIGPQRVDRRQRFLGIAAKEHRWTLPLEIAEIGTVLSTARERSEIRREVPRDFGRIGQPLAFIALEPAETVAEDNPAANAPAPVLPGDAKREAVERE